MNKRQIDEYNQLRLVPPSYIPNYMDMSPQELKELNSEIIEREIERLKLIQKANFEYLRKWYGAEVK